MWAACGLSRASSSDCTGCWDRSRHVADQASRVALNRSIFPVGADESIRLERTVDVDRLNLPCFHANSVTHFSFYSHRGPNLEGLAATAVRLYWRKEH